MGLWGLEYLNGNLFFSHNSQNIHRNDSRIYKRNKRLRVQKFTLFSVTIFQYGFKKKTGKEIEVRKLQTILPLNKLNK